MALARLVLYSAAVYLFFLLGFPNWSGKVYHVTSASVLLGGAVGVYIFLKILDWSSAAGKMAIELGFVAAVALYLGYTMPQKSGKAPLEQWAEGRRPTRSDARAGLTRLGVDANSKPAEWLIACFPKS